MLKLCAEREKHHQTPKGQGVIEYSGALVIAAVIVAMGITVLPPNVASLIGSLTTSIVQFFQNQLPA